MKPTMSTRAPHFGPHNIYENRPDGMVSDQTIFSTYQNAGIRVTDISNAYQPSEIAAFVPPKPNKLMGPPPQPAARHPVLRCLGLERRPDLLKRLQWRTVHHGV